MADTSDPYGYLALLRRPRFVSDECRAAGLSDAAEAVDRAMKFSSGSPSEFLHESEKALGPLVGRSELPESIRRLCTEVIRDIDRGFRAVGGA